jgi:hypothetical protein
MPLSQIPQSQPRKVKTNMAFTLVHRLHFCCLGLVQQDQMGQATHVSTLHLLTIIPMMMLQMCLLASDRHVGWT